MSGHAAAFALAILVVLVWFAAGPIFRWGDTWQLTINTATTIITFLMVFVIQNTQTRDIEAMQVKLDALVLHTKGANNELMALEEMPEEELRKIQKEFEALGRKYQKLKARKGSSRGNRKTSRTP